MNFLIFILESQTLNGLASLLNPRNVLDLCADFCQKVANDRLNLAFQFSNEKQHFSMGMSIESMVWWIQLCFALKKREPQMKLVLDQGKPGLLWTYWRYSALKEKRASGSNQTGMGTAS